VTGESFEPLRSVRRLAACARLARGQELDDNASMSLELLVGILSLIAAVLALPKIGVRRFFIWAGVTVLAFVAWLQFKPRPSADEPEVQVSAPAASRPSGASGARGSGSGTSSSPQAPPVHATPETYRSDELPSGNCKDFSGWYSLCSPDNPEGWTIVSQVFQLIGDRSCSGWANCEVVSKTPTKICYRFRMQGHDEECGHSGNTGIHYSRGQLDVVWQHH
jgi:hypothetical protein